MSYREKLKERITSKEEFDAMLLAESAANRDLIGRPAKREGEGAERRVIEREMAYDSRPGVYWCDNGTNNMRLSDADLSDVLCGLRSGTRGHTNALHHTRWWLLREFMRYQTGQYVYTDALFNVIYDFPWLAPHQKDPNSPAVYYTPDPQAGERDIQVETTLGRLMRKLYPHLSDDVIRDAEASHRAELSSEIELITDIDAIVDAYENHTPRDWGNCMGKPRDVWRDLEGHHPIEAYGAPGFALAVGRNGSGDINARCLVWVNPDKPDDKRYVRVYGDSSLEKRLIRNGYRMAGLEGARLRLIKLACHNHGYVNAVVPYLDRPGGRSSGGELEATHVVLDGEWLRVVGVSSDLWLALRRLDVSPVSAQTTGGRVTIHETTSMSVLNSTCPVTGAEFTRDGNEMLAMWDGGMEPVSPRGLDLLYERGWVPATAVNENGTVVLMVPPGTKTFDHEGKRCLDAVEVREYFGYHKLDRRFYPDEWIYDVTKNGVIYADQLGDVDSEASMILLKDAVHAIVQEPGRHTPSVKRVHFKECMDKRTWRKIWRYRSGLPCFVHKDVPTVRTRGGRIVVMSVHAVTKLYDGTYDFSVNTDAKSVFGVTFVAPENHTFTMADRQHIEPRLVEYVSSAVRAIRENYANADRTLVNGKVAWGLLKFVRNEYGGLPSRLADGRWEMNYLNQWHSADNERWARDEAVPKLAADMQWCADNDTVPFADQPNGTDLRYLRVALFMSVIMPHIREILPQPAAPTVAAIGTNERFAIAA